MKPTMCPAISPALLLHEGSPSASYVFTCGLIAPTRCAPISSDEGACRDEEGLQGGITVQDCLELGNNLLRGNHGNQLMYRRVPDAASLGD